MEVAMVVVTMMVLVVLSNTGCPGTCAMHSVIIDLMASLETFLTSACQLSRSRPWDVSEPLGRWEPKF